MKEPAASSDIQERLHQSRLKPLLKRRAALALVLPVALGLGFAITGLWQHRFAFVPAVAVVFLAVGYATSVTDARCPKCGEKFFGNPLRTFIAKACNHCGLRPPD